MPKCKKRKTKLELSEEDYKENISNLVAKYKKKNKQVTYKNLKK